MSTNIIAKPGGVLQQQALQYAAAGLSVIPLRARSKRPLVDWEPYQAKKATSEEISAWWREFPTANVGIITGAASGIIVLDVDGPEGGKTLQERGFHVPPTAIAKTGGGGWHYLFRHPGGECRNFAGKAGETILPYVDFRGDGGYIVAPPSIHPNGAVYEWVTRLEDGIAEAPEWLRNLLGNQAGGGRLTPEDWAGTITEGRRNQELARRAGSLLDKMSAEDALPMLQGWNTAHCRPPLPAKEVEAIVESIAWREGRKPKNTRKGKAKEEKEAVERTSFLADGDLIYEEIFDGKATFLRYNAKTGGVERVDSFVSGGVTILPHQGEELTLGAVSLPTGIAEYGDTLTLLREIEEHVHKCLDVSAPFLKFAAYYVLLSWLFDRFNTLPYLRFLGDTGCGKSRALDVVGGLCYKPIMASGCVTPAPIYRMLRRWNGTLILDEADLKNSDEYHEVVTILNCGFERRRPVIRAMRDNPDNLQFLPTYGPKVFATRRRFQDPALEARCLTEIMSETTRSDIPPVLGTGFFEEQARLRSKLLLFRFRSYHNIDPEAAGALHFDGLEPRLRQLSSTFAALFANQADILKDYQAFIMGHQRDLIEQRAATKVGQVVTCLFDWLSPDTIETLETLETLETASGEKVLPVSAADISEKAGLTPQAAGQILKTLGLKTKPIKLHGQMKRCVVYDPAKLGVLKKRYLLTEEGEATVSMVSNVSKVSGDSAYSKGDSPAQKNDDPPSSCKYCGEPIEWGKDENDQWLPMEPGYVGFHECRKAAG